MARRRASVPLAAALAASLAAVLVGGCGAEGAVETFHDLPDFATASRPFAREVDDELAAWFGVRPSTLEARCARVDRRTVGRALGAPVGRWYPDDLACVWDVGGASPGRLFAAQIAEDYGRYALEDVRGEYGGHREVGGVATSAFYDSRTATLFLQDGERAFMVQAVLSPPAPPGRTLAALTAAARSLTV